MRSLALLSTLLLSGPAAAYWKGFNVDGRNPDGTCKTKEDYNNAFSRIKNGLPGPDFSAVRLYASSDCKALEHAVPAAIATDIKILVGIWTSPAKHFGLEKKALQKAIKKHGDKWIAAVSVGSEDLYRGDADTCAVAEKIYDVRGMIRRLKSKKPVGHADTWDVWVQSLAAPVVKACDFVGMNASPYYQNVTADRSAEVFFHDLEKTRAAVKKVDPKIPVWVTQTGHPVAGPDFGEAHPSLGNAKGFWKDVGCKIFGKMDVFWFIDQDYKEEVSFGAFDKNNETTYVSKC
ncbi:MAG: hypothetical protein M1831_000045 [Alyxoria varia]|nr:MAG: hypothetical protein M1831_000045 [Alyxoria varia]